ncbi:MAG: S8 family peptidase [Oscillospiraceae bacterium]|nr:S8 family peptidase [Oscillospiraceae bacterium]
MEYIIKYTGDILSLDYPTELLDAQFAIMELGEQSAEGLLAHRQVTCFEPARRLSCFVDRSMEAACVPPVQRETGLGLTGEGVLIGFVDSGLDLTHPEFQREDGSSRVAALWDMTAEGTPPEGFRQGTVFSGAEIAAGLVSSADQSGHGTAVAAIAAGRSGVAPGASIAAVKLASSRTTDVMRAVKFLLDQAEERGMPCVVNLSYGTNCGSHWGHTLFESYIDQSAQRGRSVVVCAAGNEGSGAHHFQGRLTEGGAVDAEFTVSTRREQVCLSLWKSFADEAAFELVLPSGQSTGPLTEGARSLRFGAVRVSVLYGVPTHYSTSQEVLMLLEAPAGGLDGLWRLRCHGRRVSDGRFNVWLPTMEEVTDRTAFLQPEPDLTITLPATALYPISVGGFRPDTETISPFSGRGVQDCAGRSLLDITAPAEGVRSARAGGGYDVFTGTSMAAPFVSGAAALMMEWGIVQGNDLLLYNQRVKAFLCKGAVRSPFMAYPNPQWGYGRLNLCGTMNELVNQLERGL